MAARGGGHGRPGTSGRWTSALWVARAAAAPVAGGLLGLLLFFRQPIGSGFTRITGDDGDARLIVLLHEHWVQLLRGTVAWSTWSDLGFFHPAAHVLGYSDTFVLDEIFYAPLRLAGVDQFLAYQLTLMADSLVGYAGMLLLVRRLLPRPGPLAVATTTLLAMTFAFSNMLFVQAGHTQLYGVYWLPALILLLRRVRLGSRTPVTAFLAGLLLGLLFLSTYYVAWFAVLAATLWLLILLAISGGRRIRLRQLLTGLRRRRNDLLAAAAGTTIGVLPFLLVYLPTLGSGGRSLGVALGYAAQPLDLFNTGRRNGLWGPVTRRLYDGSPRLSNGELGFGLTPVLLAVLVVATGYFWHRHRSGARTAALPLSVALTAWAAIVLPMKFFGLSAWFVIWYLVPGAQAIRAIDRIGVISWLLVPLVAALLLADLLRLREHGQNADEQDPDQQGEDERDKDGQDKARNGHRRRVAAAAIVVSLLLVAEQYNLGHNADIDRPAQLAALAAVPAPPSSCRAFFVTVPAARPPVAYVASIDAMLIAQHLQLPTINGFSGQFPAGYGAVADPGSPAYPAAVSAWISRHELADGLCRYDVASRRWAAAGPAPSG